MLGLAAVRAFEGPPTWFLVHMGSNDGTLVGILLGSWVAMGIAYVLGRIVGNLRLERALADAPARSGRPHDELERLRAVGPRHAAVAALLARVCKASVGWPLAAMGLLLPLTLHLGFWTAMGGPGGSGQWSDFDGWIRMTAVYVGVAHLVLAGWSARLGARLEGLTAPAAVARADGWTALGLTSLASCLPGIVMLGVPVLLTAVTGVFFIPLSFYLAGKRFAEEREVLAPLLATPA
jgi:hypothetical protein